MYKEMHPHTRIVFFDGYCVLCNGLVHFLMKADRRKKLQFASLQGKTAETMPVIRETNGDSIVFYEKEEIHLASDAVILIAVALGGFWKLAVLGRIVPRSLRNAIYRLIARNRYRWFGQRNTCRIPGEKDAGRLLP